MMSLVLEVVLERLRQWECVDVMDALSTQSQSSYSSAQVHEGEGLRCDGQERGATWLGSKQLVQASMCDNRPFQSQLIVFT